VLVVLALLTAVSAVHVAAGPEATAWTAAAALVLGTSARLHRLRARRTAALKAQGAVAEASALLLANLKTGMVPTRALTSAAGSCPVLREAHQTLELGGDPAEVWRRQARGDGQAGLLDLARAWQVGTASGASLTGTLDQVTVGLAEETALRSVVSSELAAPRATGKVMAALPVLGVGMGYLLGGDPIGWLTAALPGWVCLVVGTALACAGVLWIESLARRAAAQG